MVGEGAGARLTPSAYGPVKLFQENYYFGSSPGNCQMRIQHPVKYLRSSALRKYLTDESRYLFSQNSHLRSLIEFWTRLWQFLNLDLLDTTVWDFIAYV